MMPDRPLTEVWMRNVGNYIIECAEVGAYNIVFDYAYAMRRRINPPAYANLHFGVNAPWRCLVIGARVATLWENGHDDPTAVWPVWSAADMTEKDLVGFIKYPWSENKNRVDQWRLATEHRPIPGQRHIVVISDLPDMRLESSRLMLLALSEFQVEHPEVTFFIHGLYSYQAQFGNDFLMTDVDARASAGKGQVVLPSGRKLYPEDLRDKSQYWLHILGYNRQRLKVARERCMYNIKSALFAGSYWKSLRRFAVRYPKGTLGAHPHDLDWENPEMEAHVKENSLVFTSRLVKRPGDRVVCDDCSLWMSCKYYREGAVCAVPETEMSKIAELFQTRNSTNIQKALTNLVVVQADRIQRGLDVEATPDKVDGKDVAKPVDPNLSKLISDTFKMGERLLEITDPQFRKGRAQVSVNVVSGAASQQQVTVGDDQKMVAHVITMLEARGIRREDMTTDMVNEVLRELASEQPAIPGTVEN